MNRKLISVFLIAMMLFSMLPVAAFAADGDAFVVELQSVENVNPGDQITVDVNIVDNPGVVGAEIKLDYDDTVLTFVEAELEDATGFTGTVNTFALNLEADNDTFENVDYVGKVATFTFAVSENAVKGEAYEITGNYVTLFDENFEDLTGEVLKATITMVAAPPTTYAVTVTNGTADAEEAVAGTTVTITANVPEGKEFVNWTGNVTFANANAVKTTFEMPEGAANVKANFKDKADAVTVEGGSANVEKAVEGTTVTITANVPAGKEFVNWTGNVTFANANAVTTTLEMPEGPANVKANFKDKVVDATKYAVTVTSGTATPSKAAEGETVTITAAPAPAGKTFDKWLVLKGDVNLANSNAAETTFVMPDMDVEVAAQYKTKSSGGSGGGIGGGGAIIAPSDKDTNKDDAKQDAEAQKVIVLTIGEKEAMVDNKVVVSDVAPLIKEGRTYTPARFVAEQLGAKVTWNEAKQLVTVTKGDIVIELTINSTVAKVNGKAVEMDAAAFIRDSRTYTPARFVAEQLGAKVVWDDTTRQVTITAANI